MKYAINKKRGAMYVTEADLKLNANCKAEEKSGEGKGSCGGATGSDKGSSSGSLKKLAPAGSKISEDGVSWGKKGGHAGATQVKGFVDKIQAAGWKKVDGKQGHGGDGSAITNGTKYVSPDGKWEAKTDVSYGSVASDNRFSVDIKPVVAETAPNPDKMNIDQLAKALNIHEDQVSSMKNRYSNMHKDSRDNMVESNLRDMYKAKLKGKK